MPAQDQNNGGLRRTLNEKLIEALIEVSALRAELRTSLDAMNAKIDRLLVLEKQVQEPSQAIVRIKTLWSVLAAGIALTAATLKDWIFGHK